MSPLKRKGIAMAVAKEDLSIRVNEAANALRVQIPMRVVAVELIYSHDYEKAAEKAGVAPDAVRGWAEDPLFIAAIGWLVVGLADNHEC